MKEEKKVMYEKIHKYEKELENKASSDRKCQDLEGQLEKLK